MDEYVIRAMARWPDVPAVHGWLALDRRGGWRIKGARLSHRKAVAFINRNYAVDASGCWYFQNGPQSELFDLNSGGADTERIETAVTEIQAGRPSGLVLNWQGRTLSVGPIRRAAVAARFGFDPDPESDIGPK